MAGIALKLDNIKSQLSSIATVISMSSVVVGLVMIFIGLMKLKEAADSQGQKIGYGSGLWRLAIGGVLCADFEIANIIKGTVTGVDGTANFSGLDNQ